MLSNLRNVSEHLVNEIGHRLGLGFNEFPVASVPSKQPIALSLSPALSIVRQAGKSFKGRKVGILLSDGADSKIVDELKQAIDGLGAKVEIICSISQFSFEGGNSKHADYILEGGISAFFDAVVVLATEQEFTNPIKAQLAKEWIGNAFMHCKFIAYATNESKSLIIKSGIPEPFDEGIIHIGGNGMTSKFIDKLPQLRFWDRVLKSS
jgi:catalase